MQLLKLTSFRWFLGLLFTAWAICVFLTLNSCNPAALFNPKSYGGKWSNTYLWFKPGEMQAVYVAEVEDFSKAVKLFNGDEYLVEWNCKAGRYTLRVVNRVEEIDFAWFSGYDAESANEEIPWIYEGEAVILTSDRLLPPDSTGFYRISLSNDLKD